MIADSVVGLNADNRTPLKSLTSGLSTWILVPVYAQSASAIPDWVSTNGQTDSLGTYFVGVYHDTSLDMAKKGSYEQALDRAVERYQADHQMKGDPEQQYSLLSLMSQLGIVTDTWIDRGSTVYTYYTRLRVTSRVAGIALPPAVTADQEPTAIQDFTRIDNNSAVKVPNTGILLLLEHMGSSPASVKLYAISSGPKDTGFFHPYQGQEQMAKSNVSRLKTRLKQCDGEASNLEGYSVQCFSIDRHLLAKSRNSAQNLGVIAAWDGHYKINATDFHDTWVEVQVQPVPQ